MITRSRTKLGPEPEEEGGCSQEHASNWNRNQRKRDDVHKTTPNWNRNREKREDENRRDRESARVCVCVRALSCCAFCELRSRRGSGRTCSTTAARSAGAVPLIMVSLSSKTGTTDGTRSGHLCLRPQHLLPLHFTFVAPWTTPRTLMMVRIFFPVL